MSPEDIRAVRERLGYSQTEFGALFRVSHPAVAGWERGTKRSQGLPQDHRVRGPTKTVGCRVSTALFAMATTYSTPAASRWAKISGVAKPASRRTRSRAPGKARQNFGSSRCSRLGYRCVHHDRLEEVRALRLRRVVRRIASLRQRHEFHIVDNADDLEQR